MIDHERINSARHKALLDSKQTKETIFAFSNGKTFIVYNPLSAKHCIEEQNRAGAYLVGRFRNGSEV
jgi:hypothetical protein